MRLRERKRDRDKGDHCCFLNLLRRDGDGILCLSINLDAAINDFEEPAMQAIIVNVLFTHKVSDPR